MEVGHKDFILLISDLTFIKITKKDGDGSCYDHGLTEGEREYKSSDPTSSLYCIMQGLYQLSLKENCARP